METITNSANANRRSQSTVRLVREETLRDGSVILIEANMPAGRGINQGHGGAIDWMNMNVGWRPYDEYMAEKNSEQAEAKRKAESEKADKTDKGKK